MQPTGLERRVQPNGAPRTVNDERRSTGLYRREPLDSFVAIRARRRRPPPKPASQVSTDPANPASEVSIDPGRLPLRKGRKAGELVDGDRGIPPFEARGTSWASGQLPLVTDVPGSPSAGALEFDAAYGFDRVRRASDGDVRPGHRTRTDM